MKMTYYIGAGIAVVLLIFIAYWYGSCNPNNDVINQLTESVKAETIKQYEQKISDLDKKLKSSQKAYDEAQYKYNTIVKKIKEIKNGKESIKPPETADDLNNRYNALGFTVVGSGK